MTSKKNLFWIGLTACALGSTLIWLADGSEHWPRKALVLSGLALCLLGLGFLRYLCFSKKRIKA